ncbi:MAG TPA: DinB family protein [Bryobacteraceae bacterium]
MRTVRTIASFAVLAAWMLPATAASMSQRDRERLVAHLEMTGSWLPGEVSSLSPEQLSYRSAPGRWTVAEVVEHLVIAEPEYWKLFQDGAAHPARELKNKASDADVLWYGIDRTRHEKTEARKDPQGLKVNISEALARFAKMHATMLSYAATTTDDLRSHTVPEWGVDAYQCLLEISTHEQRHILQIREIKADPNFPKH